MFKFFVRVPITASPKTPITESALIGLLFEMYQVFVTLKLDHGSTTYVTCFRDERRNAFCVIPRI